ncbi:hypothetical protein V8E55_005323 [Tylopilus felleus]
MICYSHLLKPITSVRSLARSHRPRAIVGSPSVSHARPHLSLVEPPGHHTVVPTASVSTLTSPTPPCLSFCVHAEARLPYPTVVRSSFGLFSAAIIQTLMFTNIRARKHNAGHVRRLTRRQDDSGDSEQRDTFGNLQIRPSVVCQHFSASFRQERYSRHNFNQCESSPGCCTRRHPVSLASCKEDDAHCRQPYLATAFFCWYVLEV